jgi:RNA polymerase sigma factor (TIGR02999 family)
MSDQSELSQALEALNRGDSAAADRLLPVVYEELRALASSYFRAQPADHTLQPTALVHEAFVRLLDKTGLQFNDRSHFFAVAATAMRQILTDHARRSRAQKRGGEWEKVNLNDVIVHNENKVIDAIALDDSLNELQQLDARQHRVVELRFFGGLEMAEIARVLGVSKATVELDWRAARAWLNVQLSRGSEA